eukprot:TRINITY_DN1347_c0_g1_i1.p2 TRINITY_DN1347_c0_g1~~TRINITY_DN1347_c0_g1_i1.p2  ORF type:complete len:155 (+),score=27.81 TRINITY_DN1347_c0_g1_i1:31-495(+)
MLLGRCKLTPLRPGFKIQPLQRLYSTQAQSIKTLEPREAYWLVRRGSEAILVDARPKREHEAYHIYGSFNITPTTPPADYADIPMDRPVFIYGSGEKGDTAAAKVYQLLSDLKHPSVAIIKGSPDIIRNSGFMYSMNVEEWNKILEEKKPPAPK